VGVVAFSAWRNNSPARPPAPPLSIIVMPVVNLTGDPAHENTADDMTEALADALARASGIAVIAPSTAFSFKGTPVDARRIGTLLNVRYVLEGTLRMEESRPVLTMRLADASTAVQLWNQEFRPAAMPELRDVVAGHVASTLGLHLMHAATAKPANGPEAVSPKAVELLGRARAVLRWSGKGVASMAQARSLLEKAVREDEKLADAWGMLAFTYISDSRFSASRESDLRRAEEAVRRALALAPDTDAGHYIEGWLYYEQGRMKQALTAFERATELNSNNVRALFSRHDVIDARPAE
jgi:adenylate cyclase